MTQNAQIDEQINIIQGLIKQMSDMNQIIAAEITEKLVTLLSKEIDVAETNEDKAAVIYASSLSTLILSREFQNK
jgi:hypothetical protein